MKPEKIELVDKTSLRLLWNNGKSSVFTLMNLRKFCPCATCEQERGEWSDTYIPLFMKSQITIREIRPVGSYAINLVWEDGHNTGIYEYAKLLLQKAWE